MFETLDISVLQHYWWFLVSLLGALLVFLMFVQGSQSFVLTLPGNEQERTLLINTTGRKWEFTFTTLVTFGGAFFASFPLFYSTSFGGAYWVWLLILSTFILQAVSYEFRSKLNNFLGKKTYDWFLFLNGVLGPILIGTAVATFFTGSAFSVNKMNITEIFNPAAQSVAISQWEGAAHGLEAVLDWRNPLLGLAILFCVRILGLLYAINSIDHKDLVTKCRKALWLNTALFLVFFLTFVGVVLTMDGYGVDPTTKVVSMVEFKYLNNFLEMPIVLSLFLIGVLAALFGIIKTLFSNVYRHGIWFTGIGVVFVVLSVFLLVGYNNTAYYPSSFGDFSSSLTIENSSSSHFTLTAMSYVSLLIPFVLAYIWWAWRSINKKPMTTSELKEKDEHIY